MDASQSPAAAPDVAIASGKFCPACGQNLHRDAELCPKCGVRQVPFGAGAGPDWLTTLLLCLFLGAFGVHRFYSRSTGIGVAQLLTLGGCGIWAFIDLIMLLVGSYKDGNGNVLVRR